MDFGLIFPCIQPFWGLGPTGHCWFTLGTERQRPRLGGEKSVDFGALYWPTWCRLVSCRLGVSSTELTFPTSPADVSVRVSPSPSASCATSHRLRAVPWSCAPTSASALRPACGWVPPDLPWRAGWKGGTVAQTACGKEAGKMCWRQAVNRSEIQDELYHLQLVFYAWIYCRGKGTKLDMVGVCWCRRRELLENDSGQHLEVLHGSSWFIPFFRAQWP